MLRKKALKRVRLKVAVDKSIDETFSDEFKEDLIRLASPCFGPLDWVRQLVPEPLECQPRCENLRPVEVLQFLSSVR